MRELNDSRELEDCIKLNRDRERLQKRCKDVEKYKKDARQKYHANNVNNQRVSETAFKSFTESNKSARRSLQQKESNFAQRFQTFKSDCKRQLESFRELNRLKLQESQNRLSFMNDMSDFYKRRVFEKH